MPIWWNIIRTLFSPEPLKKEPCIKANAIFGLLGILSVIMAFAIESLKGRTSPVSLSDVIINLGVSLILLSAWYVHTFSDKDPSKILVLHGVMCILATGYFLYNFSGVGEWWKTTTGNKRVSISPGFITIGLVYGVRLIGDFSYMDYNRKTAIWSAFAIGLIGDIYVMTVFFKFTSTI